MQATDFYNLVTAERVVNVAFLVLGAIGGAILAKLRKRMVVLGYTVRHWQVARAQTDAVFGNIAVTWHGHAYANIWFSRVELRNNTNTDLTSFVVRAYTAQTQLLSHMAVVVGTTQNLALAPAFSRSWCRRTTPLRHNRFRPTHTGVTSPCRY